MKLQLLGKLMLTVLFLGAAACGKTSDSGNRARGAGVGNLAVTCSNGQSAVGYVADDDGNFRENVLGLISATTDPSLFGEISGDPRSQTGVDMVLKLNNAGGTVQASGTMLQLVVYDSYVGQPSQTPGQSIQPYGINLPAIRVADAGNELHITFGDDSGTVTVRVREWNNTTVEGLIDYANTRSVNGMAMSGHLGRFVTPSCGGPK